MPMSSTWAGPNSSAAAWPHSGAPFGAQFGLRLAGWLAELLADLVRGPQPPAPAEPRSPLPPRYCHPALGLTWDGRGRQPQWLRDAVLRDGYLIAQLRCAQDVSDLGAARA